MLTQNPTFPKCYAILAFRQSANVILILNLCDNNRKKKNENEVNDFVDPVAENVFFFSFSRRTFKNHIHKQIHKRITRKRTLFNTKVCERERKVQRSHTERKKAIAKLKFR